MKASITTRLLGTAAMLAPCLSATTAWAQFDIDPAVSVFAGTQPSGAAVGDYDGDGDMDLATTVDGPDRVQFLVNDGTGAFSAGISVNLPASSSPGDVVAGDLDGDGDIDLAVALKDNHSIIAVINNGGSFSLGAETSVGDNPRGLDIADMDNDGDLDLAIANRDSNNASVLWNQGNATFMVVTVSVGEEPRGATFGDFDNDGDLDVAVSNHDTRDISILVNQGKGVVIESTVLAVNQQVRPERLIAADLDGDGDDDIAVATNGNGFEFASVFLNNGGSFSGPFDYPSGGQDTGDIIAADFDCDGMMDLATANKDSGNVSFLRNIGGGVFGAATVMSAGAEPEELGAGDFDGDGDTDLAVANRSSNDLSVFINQTCAPIEPCPWDLDADGVVSTGDLIVLLGSWGNPYGTADLIDLLGNWGACP